MKAKKWLQAGLVVLGMTASGFAPSAFGILTTVTNLYEFFDTNTVGVAPSGWNTGTAGGFAVVTNSPFVTSPHSLLLANTNVGTAAYALKSLSPTISSNYDERVFVSYRIQLAQVNASVSVLLTDATTAMFLRNSFNNIGQITTRSNATDVVLGSYMSNVWYDVRMAFTPLVDNYDIEVRTNDTLIASASSLPFAGDRNFVYFYMQNFGKAGGQANAFVDNVFVYVPEPGTALLLGGGLAALLPLRRKKQTVIEKP